MNLNDIFEQLGALNDKDLKKVQDNISSVLKARENKKRQQLIDNFQRAFKALSDNNIFIEYSFQEDDDSFTETVIDIDNWEKISFY